MRDPSAWEVDPSKRQTAAQSSNVTYPKFSQTDRQMDRQTDRQMDASGNDNSSQAWTRGKYIFTKNDRN